MPRRHGSARPLANATRRVLVVDDEQAIRAVCRVNLTASGIDVLEAADGESGFDIARRDQPDLILLDVMMPGPDGWDVARRLAAQHLGGVGYVVKPFDPVRLGDLVEDVLARIERGEKPDLQREITEGVEEKP